MARKTTTIENDTTLPPGHSLPHKPSQLELTPEEMQAVLAARQQLAAGGPQSPAIKVDDLAKALVDAINATKPPEKKTITTRKRNSPYWPKDGSPKLRLKRKSYQHGVELDDDMLHNSEVEKLNRLKAGKYCNGYVHVIKRKDGGINIEYPVRTAAQRLRLVNDYGISKFEDLLDRILDERANPHKYRRADDDEDE